MQYGTAEVVDPDTVGAVPYKDSDSFTHTHMRYPYQHQRS
jgi:hypothetical protein